MTTQCFVVTKKKTPQTIISVLGAEPPFLGESGYTTFDGWPIGL